MIEVGCLCRVVNARVSANEGRVVTAVSRHERLEGYWVTDTPMKDDDGNYGLHIHERQLQRIDEGNKKISWEDMEDLWVPDLEKVL